MMDVVQLFAVEEEWLPLRNCYDNKIVIAKPK